MITDSESDEHMMIILCSQHLAAKVLGPWGTNVAGLASSEGCMISVKSDTQNLCTYYRYH